MFSIDFEQVLNQWSGRKNLFKVNNKEFRIWLKVNNKGNKTKSMLSYFCFWSKHPLTTLVPFLTNLEYVLADWTTTCRANQWTGFSMIETSVMKELKAWCPLTCHSYVNKK